MNSVIFSEWTILAEYQRELIEQGEWWRMLSAHFVHYNLNHFLVNLAGLCLMYFINDRYLVSWRGGLAVIFLSLWISTGIWFFYPELRGLAGFSGVLHGLFILVIASQNDYSPPVKAVLLSVITGKVILEQVGLTYSGLMTISYGNPVSYTAHLYGMLGGYFLLFCQQRYRIFYTRILAGFRL